MKNSKINDLATSKITNFNEILTKYIKFYEKEDEEEFEEIFNRTNIYFTSIINEVKLSFYDNIKDLLNNEKEYQKKIKVNFNIFYNLKDLEFQINKIDEKNKTEKIKYEEIIKDLEIKINFFNKKIKENEINSENTLKAQEKDIIILITENMLSKIESENMYNICFTDTISKDMVILIYFIQKDSKNDIDQDFNKRIKNLKKIESEKFLNSGYEKNFNFGFLESKKKNDKNQSIIFPTKNNMKSRNKKLNIHSDNKSFIENEHSTIVYDTHNNLLIENLSQKSLLNNYCAKNNQSICANTYENKINFSKNSKSLNLKNNSTSNLNNIETTKRVEKASLFSKKVSGISKSLKIIQNLSESTKLLQEKKNKLISNSNNKNNYLNYKQIKPQKISNKSNNSNSNPYIFSTNQLVKKLSDPDKFKNIYNSKNENLKINKTNISFNNVNKSSLMNSNKNNHFSNPAYNNNFKTFSENNKSINIDLGKLNFLENKNSRNENNTNKDLNYLYLNTVNNINSNNFNNKFVESTKSLVNINQINSNITSSYKNTKNFDLNLNSPNNKLEKILEYNNCSNYQEHKHNKFHSLNVNKIQLVDKYSEIKTLSNQCHTNAQSPNPTNNTNQIYYDVNKSNNNTPINQKNVKIRENK